MTLRRGHGHRRSCLFLTAVALTVFNLVFTAPSSASAQRPGAGAESPDPFILPGHIEPLRFNALLFMEGDVGPRGVNGVAPGFNVTDARLGLRGQMEQGFSYFIQAEFKKADPLLDLILEWRASESGTRIRTGTFRTPFSEEFQIGAPDLDFVERAQVARALAPARQVGFQLDQELAGEHLVVRAGVFNGEGQSVQRDERLLYTLRLDGETVTTGDCEVRVGYGINGAFTNDAGYSALAASLPLRDPEIWLGGGDIRIEHGAFLYSAEGIYGSVESQGEPDRDIWGYQASVGWQVLDWLQLLARYDALHGEGPLDGSDLAIGSAAIDFTAYVNLQLEIRVPTRGSESTPGGAASFGVQF